MPDSDLRSVLERVAQELVTVCSHNGLTFSTAESLTAGMASSAVASVPGASAVLLGAAVTYTNEIKHKLLGVSEETIDRVTEVSAPVAAQMAQGAAELFGSDIAVSLTGYAGPGGGTEDNPVGTVYLGIYSSGVVKTECDEFSGSRERVREQAALRALELALDAASR